MKLGTLFVVVFVIAISILFLRLYATVSTCGWKGLFVECRITEQSK